MKNSTIRLNDDEVDLSNYKIGDICEIKIKGKMMGQKVEEDYGDMGCMVGSPSEKKKEPKKYIEYTLDVQKAKINEPEKKGDNFFEKDKRVGETYTKGRA